ncbi:MAG TPA: VLRF1 family aeRF1-type release factor [Longimicrobiales bacterium]|nr:VLRF1 family aeRF1-type release factor [Longimicrobiales bacterium]
MITTNDIQRLIEKDTNGRETLSLYLDMSVNASNKRTHQVFLSKQRAGFAELQSERERHHREPMGALFARVERWIDEEFDPANRGVAIFADVGGDWFEAFQFPTAVTNRLELADHAVIAPLTQVARTHPRSCIVVVDREHLRMVATHMGQVLDEHASAPDAIPTAHDVQAGGYSQRDYQKRKAEETRHFFRQFADEVTRFGQRHQADHFALLGTTENTKHFREFLPKEVADRIVHEGHTPAVATAVELVRNLQPVLDELQLRDRADAINLIRDRVRQAHFATAGVQDTLVQLQEGKVERLVVASDLDRQGVQCTQCNFYLVRRDGPCPYCGGELRDGVDLVESMIRMAATQAADVDVIAGNNLEELNGVGALLKFR